MSMPYWRRVVKRRPASLTESEWLDMVERGKLPRLETPARPGRTWPAVDVSDLVFRRQLDDLSWRLEKLCMAMLRPTVSGPANGSLSSLASQGQLLRDFSELWEFLTGLTYQDGKPRQTGSISLKCFAGKIQVTLTDPSGGCYCCQSSASLDDAFLALEIGLKEGTLPWRPSGYAKEKRK